MGFFELLAGSYKDPEPKTIKEQRLELEQKLAQLKRDCRHENAVATTLKSMMNNDVNYCPDCGAEVERAWQRKSLMGMF